MESEPALGRLLDRAAGALCHTHPGLADELTQVADRCHEPPDPFLSLVGETDVDRFRTFGYVVLPGFFDADTVRELRSEVERTLRAVHGERYEQRPPMSGMACYEAYLLGPWAPRTVEIVDSRRLVGLAERFLGGSVLPSPCDTQAALFFDHAGWHNDIGIDIRGVKFAAYFDSLDGDTGALRVLPGSHRLRSHHLRYLHSIDVDVTDVPSQILATEPGDVIAFDPEIYHASWGGTDRLQWTTLYVREALTPAQQEGIDEWYAEGASWINEAPEAYRPFNSTWVSEGSGDVDDPRLDQRHRWMYRFNQLGVLKRFDAADAYRP